MIQSAQFMEKNVPSIGIIEPTCKDFGFEDCCPDCHLGLGPPLFRNGKRTSDFKARIIANLCCKHYHEIKVLGPEAWSFASVKRETPEDYLRDLERSRKQSKEQELEKARETLRAMGVVI
jgi:hypothetical protein